MKNKILISFFLVSLFTLTTKAQVFEWAFNWGGDNVIRSNAMCRDNSNHIYNAGYFSGSVDFDPGPGIHILSSDPGFQHAFISKFNSAGDFLWVKVFQGNACDQQVMSVKTDASGNVFSTGMFYGNTDFDPNAGNFFLNAIGGTDIFAAKLDSNGNFVWAKNMGIAGEFNQGTALAIDSQGDLLLGGHFKGAVDFDPNAGTQYVNSIGDYDVFILKLTTAGDFVWVKHIGGNNSVMFVKDMEVDVNHDIVLTGSFTMTVDLDPGPNQFQVMNAGAFTKDIFILKLNTGGNFIWGGGIGDINNDRGNSLVTDASGNIFVTGFFDGTVDFNPGMGVDSISGFADVFVLKLNAAGLYQWVKSFGGIYDDEGFGIDLDNNGNIYTTGGFSMPADFDPGPGVSMLTPSQIMGIGFSDIFISKLDPQGNYKWATGLGDGDNDEGLVMLSGDSNTVYIAGRFLGTADFDPSPAVYNLSNAVPGFENIFLMKLIPCAPIQDTLHISACHQYSFNGQTFTNTGIYPNTFVTAGGCDSIIYLNLTILLANTGVTQTGAILTANATGASYQWIKCNPFQLIGGATNQQLTAISNGDYAVIVTENGCTDTSSCVTVSGLATQKILPEQAPLVYPNPVSDRLDITFYQKTDKMEIKLFDLSGKIVYEKVSYNDTHFIFDLQHLPKGIYTLKLISGHATHTMKLSRL